MHYYSDEGPPNDAVQSGDDASDGNHGNDGDDDRESGGRNIFEDSDLNDNEPCNDNDD